MTRNEFMRQLEQLLKELPEHDRLDAIAYYEDYFDEAGPENETKLIQELGSPEKVAATIKRENSGNGNQQAEYTEYGYSDGGETEEKQMSEAKTEKKKDSSMTVLIVILVVCSLPVWGGLLSGIMGVLIGIVGAILGCMIALVALIVAGIAGGLAAMVIGLTKLVVNPGVGLLGIGVGSLLLAMGLLFLVMFLWLVIKVFPAVFRFIAGLCRKGWHKLKGGLGK